MNSIPLRRIFCLQFKHVLPVSTKLEILQVLLQPRWKFELQPEYSVHYITVTVRFIVRWNPLKNCTWKIPKLKFYQINSVYGFVPTLLLSHQYLSVVRLKATAQCILHWHIDFPRLGRISPLHPLSPPLPHWGGVKPLWRGETGALTKGGLS